MDAVQPKQSALIGLLHSNRAGSHLDFLQIQPGFRQHERIVGRAEHGFENVGNLLLVLWCHIGRGHLHEIRMEPRGVGFAAAGKRRPAAARAVPKTCKREIDDWISGSLNSLRRQRRGGDFDIFQIHGFVWLQCDREAAVVLPFQIGAVPH